MNKRDINQMINMCIEEISMLRKENQRLEPLADAYLSVRKVLNLLPENAKGYGEDIIWRLRKQQEELNMNEVEDNDSQRTN